jgi:hypothetical protein
LREKFPLFIKHNLSYGIAEEELTSKRAESFENWLRELIKEPIFIHSDLL